MTETTDTREQILRAAMTRILHYGYAKTTMAEIAKDCDMSAGNIYRFFKSKLDIAEAIVRGFNQAFYQLFAEIARRSDEPALPRLTELFKARLERTYHMMQNKTKALEMADVLARERPIYYVEELAQERIYIVQILEQGLKFGEIKPLDNLNFTAEMLQIALMKFESPRFWADESYEELTREFDGVMKLLEKSLT
ncbi:TetR/AcrR family transcriptional regulator [Ponticaulis sp.]|uniref:TetR/AcrR family transcriptional regulator n=1 Tax=Ponticaulis sp. TaxID=2020902 RepID=UPI000B62E097|nr:TetR/AcrR family transcriptional regulator [Ponticaulis sp.]MAJ07793.1 TetR family transcriptional regulator [Ponticaulis sp.]RPG18114.1 MAG: TetR/AcrR family transcriptional regulator [Hyphomonadaceae bacterium TMED125]HBH90489.1 TetR/AcrR family transcriptional regulator [Hyphomonadaceae bacterium]